MHPTTMQLMAEVRAQEMLVEARTNRPSRSADKAVTEARKRARFELSLAHSAA